MNTRGSREELGGRDGPLSPPNSRPKRFDVTGMAKPSNLTSSKKGTLKTSCGE
jgi:hypothetical protein